MGDTDERDVRARNGTRRSAEPAGGTVEEDAVALNRLLVDSVRDYAIFALDAEGRVVTWNAGAEQLKGYRPEEIIGRHFSTFYREKDVRAGKPARELIEAQRDGSVEDEGWRVRKDGTLFWANVLITALRDESGTLIGFAKVTRDLTDRREADERLRQSEERFRLLVHGVRDYAIFMLDPDGVIASWNEGAHRIKGYAPEEILGQHFSIFYPEAEKASGHPAWELQVATREGQYEEEGWRIRKDGTRFWAGVLITALRNDAGRLIGFAKVTRDLTERRASQERAIADARRIAEAEASSRAKSEFLAALSHELRTPINATLGYAELLEVGVGGELNEQQKNYLNRIRGSQEHLLRIISDLLNYSRIEAGQLAYDFEDVSAVEILETVVPMIEPQALAKGIDIVQVACPENVEVHVDRGRAQQIVLNLLTNAIKFTPEGGSIRVECARSDGWGLLTVQDDGIGIPEDRLGSIFEPFVQVGRSLTSGHEGAGLGLAISRDLARAMGGDLTVRSVEGEGATFTIRLPLSTRGDETAPTSRSE